MKLLKTTAIAAALLATTAAADGRMEITEIGKSHNWTVSMHEFTEYDVLSCMLRVKDPETGSNMSVMVRNDGIATIYFYLIGEAPKQETQDVYFNIADEVWQLPAAQLSKTGGYEGTFIASDNSSQEIATSIYTDMIYGDLLDEPLMITMGGYSYSFDLTGSVKAIQTMEVCYGIVEMVSERESI